MFGKTATLMKFEGVSCSKLQICIFFYENLNHLVRPTLPGQSLVINWFLWRKYFAGFLMSFTLFNQWHYNTSLCSFGHFPNYFTKFFIDKFPKVKVTLSASLLQTSKKILFNRRRKNAVAKMDKIAFSVQERGGGDDLCVAYIKKKKLWD